MNRYNFDWEPIFDIVFEYLDPQDYLVPEIPDREVSRDIYVRHKCVDKVRHGLGFLRKNAHNRKVREKRIFDGICVNMSYNFSTGEQRPTNKQMYAEMINSHDLRLDSEIYLKKLSLEELSPLRYFLMCLSMSVVINDDTRHLMSYYRIFDPIYMLGYKKNSSPMIDNFFALQMMEVMGTNIHIFEITIFPCHIVI